MGKHDHQDTGRYFGSPPDTASQIVLRLTIAKQLPYFVVVAEQGHFNRAAIALNITQSALTRRIQSLETSLGTKLFKRGRQGVTMTAAGAILYKEARRLMTRLDWVAEEVSTISRGETGRLQIALNVSSTRNPIITQSLLLYKEQHPAVELRLNVMNNDEIIAALELDSIDAGFISHVGDDTRLVGWENIFIQDIKVLLATAHDHPFAEKAKIRLSDLEGEPMIWAVNGRGRAFQNRLTNLMKRSGIVATPLVNVATTEAAVNLVSAGLAITLVPEDYPVPSNVVLHHLEEIRESVPLKMMWRNANPLATLKALQSVVSEVLEARSSR